MKRNVIGLRRLLRTAAFPVLLSVWIFFGWGCSPSSSGSENGFALKAVVTIPPQAYFVERIGGRLVKVLVLVGPGQSPEFYEPTPKQIAQVLKSDVYFRIGVPFEKRLAEKLKGLRRDFLIVDTRKGCRLRQMDVETENGKPSASAPPDPHIWLDPVLVLKQSAVIRDILCRLDPEHRSEYESGFKALSEDLSRLHKTLEKLLAPYRGRTFYVVHPAFGYFADRYGLVQKSIEAGGKEPTAKDLGRLVEEMKRAGVKVIFVESQFSRTGAEKAARAVGAEVVSLDPLSHSYIENLHSIGKALAYAFAKSGK